MGWKAGKGAGPTLSRRALEKQKGFIMYLFN